MWKIQWTLQFSCLNHVYVLLAKRRRGSWNPVSFGILCFIIDCFRIGYRISSFPLVSHYEISCLDSSLCGQLLSDHLSVWYPWYVFITFLTESVSAIYGKQAGWRWRVSCDFSSCFHVRLILAPRTEVWELTMNVSPLNIGFFPFQVCLQGQRKKMNENGK